MDENVRSSQFVSRGGHKLVAALDGFHIDVAGLVCADLGSHVGGFVDCLLQRNAARVYSVDTSYGTLAWKLRKNPRVQVFERSNAMHVTLPEPVDLVTVDVGWTPQAKVLPNAVKLLRPEGCILTLIKPHYESSPDELDNGVLPDSSTDMVVERVLSSIRALHLRVCGIVLSPIRGHGGNSEFFAHLQIQG